MPAKEKVALRPFDEIFKNNGWKKIAGFFVKNIDNSTIAHFNQPFFVRDTVRVQYGVTNKDLNNIIWKIFDIPEKFGSLKEHLTNASKCYLYFANHSIEFKVDDLEFSQAAEKIENACIKNAEKYKKMENIREEVSNYESCNQTAALSVLLCIEYLLGNFVQVRNIIEIEKINNTSFDLSVFALAEKKIEALTTSSRS